MLDGEEFRLKIEAYTPDTMPMARLAEYLAELAQMLGEGSSVHFVRLEPGSTSVIHRIEREAIPKIKNRTASVRRGIGPRDAVRAYRTINKMLREDNGTAIWQHEKTAAEIIAFPGKEEAEPKITGITQRGSIDGEIVRIGGVQKDVPIMIQREKGEIFSCWTNKTIAKRLGQRLFEPVRLFGTGRWNRDEEGKWKLDIFRVESFEPLRDTPLSAALNELRAIKTDWNDKAFSELMAIRADQEDHVDGGV